jgi:glycerol-3-phosphate acyltransferase PlsY
MAATGMRIEGRDRLLVQVYGAIALGALIATWSQNIRFLLREGNGGVLGFLRDSYANPAAASITNDILFVLLAAVVFMVVEARRLGIRHVWIYVALSLLVALSVAFPLFLIARRLKPARRPAAPDTVPN